VKRTFAFVAGSAVVGLAVLVGSQLRAQQGAAPQQPPRTRVAVLNLSSVIKNYTKYQAFEKEWQTAYQGFEKQYEGKRALLASNQNQLAAAKDDTQRGQIEAQVRNLQREMQDMSEEAKKALGKKRDDQAVIIYREIEEAVKVFARANDLELVMHYNDTSSAQDMYNPVNVQRKLSTGACMPVYFNPQMDITNSVITMLNEYYKRQMGSQPIQPTGGIAPAPGQPNR
jgi:Skp family chaperone for outer membrane proteins